MMKIKQSVYNEIMQGIGTLPPEAGGMLGIKEGVICAFFEDRHSRHRTAYLPDIATLNRQIAAWAANGIDFIGIVHSHPGDAPFLSGADMQYAERIFAANPQMNCIAFPLVTNVGSKAQLTNYVFDGRWQECPFTVVP